MGDINVEIDRRASWRIMILSASSLCIFWLEPALILAMVFVLFHSFAGGQEIEGLHVDLVLL